MRDNRCTTAALLLCLAIGSVACQGRDNAVEVDSPADTDTSGLGGLSREQIREQMQPMTPERAESLGIVDTSIHIEIPSPGDSLPRP